MAVWLIQAGGTTVDGWREVEAPARADAAAEVAAALRPGEHEVFAAVGDRRHANGTPMLALRYRCKVQQSAEG
jgi:hypothetical protein